jgi:hypothetical protein
VGEGFARLPVEVDRPKINKVKAACDRPFFDGFQFFGGRFGQGGDELGEFDVYGAGLRAKALTKSLVRSNDFSRC